MLSSAPVIVPPAVTGVRHRAAVRRAIHSERGVIGADHFPGRVLAGAEPQQADDRGRADGQSGSLMPTAPCASPSLTVLWATWVTSVQPRKARTRLP